MNRLPKLLALGACLALLAGGCGGSNSNSRESKSNVPLTKAEYVKEMDTIAKGLNESISSLGSPTNAKSAATALSKVQDDVRGTVEQLKAIRPPSNIRSAHRAMTRATADFAVELGPIISKLEKGDLASLSRVTTLKAFKELQAAATRLSKSGYQIAA